MDWDIHKLADFIEKQTRAGVAIEHKILEWKLAEAPEAAERGKLETEAVVAKAS